MIDKKEAAKIAKGYLGAYAEVYECENVDDISANVYGGIDVTKNHIFWFRFSTEPLSLGAANYLAVSKSTGEIIPLGRISC